MTDQKKHTKKHRSALVNPLASKPTREVEEWHEVEGPRPGQGEPLEEIGGSEGQGIENVWEQYRRLYELLRLLAPRRLLERIRYQGLTPYEEQALVALATLPHPHDASVGDIMQVAQECSAGCLEFAYQDGGIGPLARRILATIKDVGIRSDLRPSGPTVAGTNQILQILERQDEHLIQLSSEMKWLTDYFATRKDLDLRGQCPFCRGPLMEAIYGTEDGTGKAELRLVCLKKGTAKCEQYQWVVQSVPVKEIT